MLHIIQWMRDSAYIDAEPRWDHYGSLVLLESRERRGNNRRDPNGTAWNDLHWRCPHFIQEEIPKSSYYTYEDVFYLPRYRGMSKIEANVAVEGQLRQAQRLARARARAAESGVGATAFGTDQGGLQREGRVVIRFNEQGRAVEEV